MLERGGGSGTPLCARCGLDLADEAGVAGKAEDIIDPVAIAPGHQRLAGEAAVGPRAGMRVLGQRLRIRATMRATSSTAPAEAPMLARLSDGQKMPAAKNVQRQVPVAILIAMAEPVFLMPVQRVVGGVETKNHLPRAGAGAENARDGYWVCDDDGPESRLTIARRHCIEV